MKEVTMVAGNGPGKTLHQARTDLKLSQEDVALQLHLAPRQIVALENDDYDSLPEPTYVRGYLRAYATLLGLKPEPILESYGALLPAQKVPTGQKVNLGVDEDVNGKEPHVKIAGYVVAALVIGLTVAWWQSYEPTPAARSEITVPAPMEDETPAAPAEPPESGQGALSEAMPRAALPPSPIMARPSMPSLPAAIPPVAVAPAAAIAPAAPKPPAPAMVPAPAAPAPVVAATPPAPVVSPAPATETDLRTGRAQIVLRTEQESWAEVRDAQDSRLLYENVPAGRTVKIEGEAPLSVFLGNVDGVKVEYNGRAYDATRHKRGTVARFTLGISPPAPAAADAPTP